jgi:hypothetical protein
LQPSFYQENDQPSSPASKNTAAADQIISYLKISASADHIHDVFAEYEKTFGVDLLT